MGSLSRLLARVANIPTRELVGQKSESERPTEMALTHEVISPLDIEAARERHPRQTKIRRACYVDRGGTLRMEFRVPHAGFHTITATYSSKGLRVTDNNRVIEIGDSVDELREYIIRLTHANTKAGA